MISRVMNLYQYNSLEMILTSILITYSYTFVMCFIIIFFVNQNQTSYTLMIIYNARDFINSIEVLHFKNMSFCL